MGDDLPQDAVDAGAASSEVCLVLSGDPFQQNKELLENGEIPEFYVEVV